MVEVSPGAEITVSDAEAAVAAAWKTYWGWENYINYNLDAKSGDTTKLVIKHIPKNANIRIVNGSLIGSPHNGILRQFSGTTVSASAIEYVNSTTVGEDATVVSAGESNKAFVIDFGGIRKISALAVADVVDKLPEIAMVLPWMGIEFGSKPLFPYTEHRSVASTSLSNISFPEVETAKLFVQFDSAVTDPPGEVLSRIDEVLDKLTIISNTKPLNVKVAVGNRPVFHTFSGELKEETPLPEFSEELNAYLDEIREAGAEDIENFPLMITMDAPGQIELGTFHLVFDRESVAKWGDSNRQSLNFARQGKQQLALNFPKTNSSDWRIHSVSLEIIPEFPDWRTFPRDTMEIPDKMTASVSSELNIAQCLPIAETTDLFGLGLFISASDETSEIVVEIQSHKQGEPDNIPLLEESLTIKPNDSASWIDVLFSKPLSVTAGKDLWFILKSKVGQLAVVLEEDIQSKPVLFNRNGAGYKTFPYNSGNVSTVFRQYRKPAVGENALVVSITIADETQESDLPEETNSLTFSYIDPDTGISSGPVLTPQNNQMTLELDITAHTSGSVTFQNVIARYQHEVVT